MTIAQPTPADEVLSIILERWLVIETGTGELHFVGHNIKGTGRVSSPIVRFDIESMIGLTLSGRVYMLLGPQGIDSDAMSVWGVWSQANSIIGWQDVTAQFLSEQRTKAHPLH